MSQKYDLSGNDLVIDQVYVGASTPGAAGTLLAGSELTVLDSVTAGTASASKAVVLDASKNIAGLGTVGIAVIDADSTAATLSSNAATVTKYTSVITTESLTTAHTATATFTITLTGVAAGDLAFVQIAGGTNTGGIVGTPKAVTSTNTITVTVKNEALTTNAFNGTLIFNLLVIKA